MPDPAGARSSCSSPLLVLFDIDGTLLSTGGAGLVALERAGRELFHPAFDVSGIEFAGRLDVLIMADLLRRHGLDSGPETIARFRSGYAAHMPWAMDLHRAKTEAKPGTHELVRATATLAGAAIGLLTGNFAETGTMKVQGAGFDPGVFRVNAWGDESSSTPPTRDDLPKSAMKKYAALHGRAVEARRVVVIGDTPFDVRCARVNGCRSLAVATGKFSVAELREAGADLAVPDLRETSALVRWITGV